jgi:hypothetical protein
MQLDQRSKYVSSFNHAPNTLHRGAAHRFDNGMDASMKFLLVINSLITPTLFEALIIVPRIGSFPAKIGGTAENLRRQVGGAEKTREERETLTPSERGGRLKAVPAWRRRPFSRFAP